MDELSPHVTAQARYSALESDREPYLRRGRMCAELTIPSILPPLGHTNASELPVPWQTQGARGVNNLSAKLLLSLFPPNTPFFRMKMDEIQVKQTEASMGEEKTKTLKTQLDKAFGIYERAVMSDIENTADRVKLFEALKHTLVTGNICIQSIPTGLRNYALDHFVCKRDPSGNLLEIVTEEIVDPMVLPQDVQDAIKAQPTKSPEKTVKLHTWIKRTSQRWEYHQEACGIRIPDSDGHAPLDACPWIVVGFTRIDGEDYSRSYVEQHLGDLRSLESLTQAMVEGTAAAAKILFLCAPNKSTNPKVISEAPNGAVRTGVAEDVSVLKVEKANDFAIAKQLQNEIKTDLAYSFLMNSAVQRNAERVTAEEIRYMAGELEQTLGGFYSTLSQELQLPIVRIKINALNKKGKLPKLPQSSVRPTIVTGLEALGRGQDRTKLVGWITTLTNTIGPEVVGRRLKVTEFAERLGTADGIDTDGLFSTDEEFAAQQQQEQEQAQQSQMVDKLGAPLINAGGRLMSEGMKNVQGSQGSGEAA